MPPPLRKTLMLIAVFFIKIALMVESALLGGRFGGLFRATHGHAPYAHSGVLNLRSPLSKLFGFYPKTFEEAV